MAVDLTRADLLIEMEKLRQHVDLRMERAREERRDQMTDISMRLERIDDHLERLNSKVATHEVRIAEETMKGRAIAEHVYGRRKRDDADGAPAITKGDIKRASVGLGLIVLALEVLRYAGEFAMAGARWLTRHP